MEGWRADAGIHHADAGGGPPAGCGGREEGKLRAGVCVCVCVWVGVGVRVRVSVCVCVCVCECGW